MCQDPTPTKKAGGRGFLLKKNNNQITTGPIHFACLCLKTLIELGALRPKKNHGRVLVKEKSNKLEMRVIQDRSEIIPGERLELVADIKDQQTPMG